MRLRSFLALCRTALSSAAKALLFVTLKLLYRLMDILQSAKRALQRELILPLHRSRGRHYFFLPR